MGDGRIIIDLESGKVAVSNHLDKANTSDISFLIAHLELVKQTLLVQLANLVMQEQEKNGL